MSDGTQHIRDRKLTGKPLTVVVVPTYNEAENLVELTDQLFALDIPNLMVVIVDDDSPDGTGVLAAEIGKNLEGRIHVINRKQKLGLGPAYVEGFTYAIDLGADYVVQMDADLSHPPSVVCDLLYGLGNADVVVGSRYVRGGGADREWGLLRRLISFGGNWGIRLVAGVKIKDATGGFKAFRRHVLQKIEFDSFRCNGFGFQVEVNHACERMGFAILEQPYVFSDRAKGKSKMSLQIIIEAMWKLIPLRLNRSI